MRTPYGVNILDNCVACPPRIERLFCNLDIRVLEKFNAVKSTGTQLVAHRATARSAFGRRHRYVL